MRNDKEDKITKMTIENSNLYWFLVLTVGIITYLFLKAFS